MTVDPHELMRSSVAAFTGATTGPHIDHGSARRYRRNAADWALVSVAESMREANIESRARELTEARLRTLDEWAERKLYDLLVEHTPGLPNARDTCARTVMAAFRHDLGIHDE